MAVHRRGNIRMTSRSNRCPAGQAPPPTAALRDASFYTLSPGTVGAMATDRHRRQKRS
jgi:hypothetical protein